MRHFLKRAAIAAAVIISASANAQPVVSASYTESWITSGGVLSTGSVFGPTLCTNSATVDYTPFCGGGACSMISNPQLTAVVVDGYPGTSFFPTLYINDQTMGGWISIAIPAPQGSNPDVVVANDMSGTGDFLVGVITNNGGSVMLHTFVVPVSSLGTGSLSVLPMGSIPLGMATANTFPHIDIVGEYSTPLGGLATANKFAATWELNGTVVGCFGNMGLPAFAFPSIVINANGTSPDVAAVERFNWTSGGFEDWALFSYIDASSIPNVLYYQEWCMNPVLPPSLPIVYDNSKIYYGASAIAGTASVDRIDAIDNYTYNTPNPEHSTFCIVAPVAEPVTVEDFEYNDRLGPGPGVDITSGLTVLSLQKKVIPTVTCGPGFNYSIGFFSYSSGGTGDTYNSVAIDQATGLQAGGGIAYTMNRLPYSSTTSGISHAGTCNNDMPGQQQLFASWINQDDLWYKYSNTAAPYNYKHQTATTATVAATEWTASPNPANDHISLSAPATFAVADGATYQVMDMTGKTAIQHAVNGANEQININSLPSGMYVINIHSQKEGTKTIKFVKE